MVWSVMISSDFLIRKEHKTTKVKKMLQRFFDQNIYSNQYLA